MKQFIYKSIITVIAAILIFEFTIGNKISNIYEKTKVVSSYEIYTEVRASPTSLIRSKKGLGSSQRDLVLLNGNSWVDEGFNVGDSLLIEVNGAAVNVVVFNLIGSLLLFSSFSLLFSSLSSSDLLKLYFVSICYFLKLTTSGFKSVTLVSYLIWLSQSSDESDSIYY